MSTNKLPALPPRPRGIQVVPQTRQCNLDDLERIHQEVQSAIHDQWDWMEASFAVECLRCELEDQDARIAQLVARVGELECFVNPATALQDKQSQRIAGLEREIREARDKARKEFGGVITELAANKSLLRRDDYNLGWNDGVDKAAYFIRKYMNGRGLFQDDRRNAERENHDSD